MWCTWREECVGNDLDGRRVQSVDIDKGSSSIVADADMVAVTSDMTGPSNMVVVLLTASRKPWSETKEMRLLSTSVMSTVASQSWK